MFAAYSIMSLSPSGDHLVIGNLSGNIKVLSLPYQGMFWYLHMVSILFTWNYSKVMIIAYLNSLWVAN